MYLFGLMKSINYSSILDLIRLSRMSRNKKAMSKLIFYLILFLIYMHITGCFFFLACLYGYKHSTDKLY